LASRAKIEREMELHDQSVDTPRGLLPLLGLDLVSKCFTKPKAFEGRLFVAVGIVLQHAGLPSSNARKLGSNPDHGAIFRISRMVAKGLPQYLTVFATKDEHSDQLIELHGSMTRVSMIVREFYAPPEGSWRGFMGYDGTALTPGKKIAF